MRNAVVFGNRSSSPFAGASFAALRRPEVVIDGCHVQCGVVPARDVTLDRIGDEGGHGVLVRVRALSCNYRDKGLILRVLQAPSSRFAAFGSEFCAEVVDVGERVESLAPGDRVMADPHYEGRPLRADGVRAGLPTNQASKALHVFHERQLHRVPNGMPDATAAAFALNAQTAYSMVRRLDPAPDASVLVTSGSSNTSLFLLGALRLRGVRLAATTTSERAAERLRALGVPNVAVVGRHRDGFANDPALAALAREAGGFDHVFDPFFDLHVAHAVELLNPFGSYVTCGLAGQTPHASAEAGVDGPLSMHGVLMPAMMKNLSLVGNCIGLRSDLAAAARDYEAGLLAPVVDSVFTGDDVAPFLDRTFNDSARFGKVVYRYE